MIEEERMKMIMDHYENPRNFGPLESPTVISQGRQPELWRHAEYLYPHSRWGYHRRYKF